MFLSMFVDLIYTICTELLSYSSCMYLSVNCFGKEKDNNNSNNNNNNNNSNNNNK